MCLLSTGEDTQLTLQVKSGETELPLPPRRNDRSRGVSEFRIISTRRIAPLGVKNIGQCLRVAERMGGDKRWSLSLF